MTDPIPADLAWEYGKGQAEILLQEFLKGHYNCCAEICGEIRNSEDGERKLFVIVVALLAGTGIVDDEESESELVGVYAYDPKDTDKLPTKLPVDALPPFVRVLARLPVAVANFDMDTAWALWHSVPFEDQIRMTAAVLKIVDTTLDQHLDVRRRTGGLN